MLSIVQVIISSSERLVFNPYFLSIFSPAACSFFEGAEVLSQGAEVRPSALNKDFGMVELEQLRVIEGKYPLNNDERFWLNLLNCISPAIISSINRHIQGLPRFEQSQMRQQQLSVKCIRNIVVTAGHCLVVSVIADEQSLTPVMLKQRIGKGCLPSTATATNADDFDIAYSL